jgi:hypothetical protein
MAKPHGESVKVFVEQLFHQLDYPEIGYKRAMGVIQLHKQYGSDRLNIACKRAMHGNVLSYKRVHTILKNNLDKNYQLYEELNNHIAHIPKHENIRGAANYN